MILDKPVKLLRFKMSMYVLKNITSLVTFGPRKVFYYPEDLQRKAGAN